MKPGRNDMKKALERLQVNRPLRLPGEGPGLVPPQQKAEQMEVPPKGAPPKEEPREQVPQKHQPPNERPYYEVSESGVTQIEDAQIDGAQYEASSRTGKVGKRNDQAFREREATQSGNAHDDGPPIEHTQNEGTRFQGPHNEVPDYGEPQLREPSAASFFRLSPRVFSESVTRNMSGDCFRLFLWLSWRAWRFPNSPGVVRAAVSFIEMETGMGHATVSRCLKTLKELKLVTLVETNFKRGNVWKVSNLACPGRVPDPGPGGKQPKKEAARKEVAGASHAGGHSLKSSNERPQSELHIKNYKNLRKPHCSETQLLLNRIDRIEAPKKRIREAASLESLLAKFESRTVLQALEFVEKKGTLKGEPCHSPFGYLTVAIDDVLKRVFQKTAAEKAVVVFEVPVQSASIEATAALESFQQELSPPERDQFLETFIHSEFPHGFLPPRRVTESLAAVAWLTKARSGSKLGLAV
jgi:hypothetical protein